MAVWRLQEHSPDVYPRKSRDYQLFSVLFDCVNSGIKFDIDTIRDIVDTNQISERLIPYLQTKLGYFTNIKIPTDKLRTILKAFSLMVRNKGSKTGIQQACEVFLKIEKIDATMTVEVVNEKDTDGDDHYVKISTTRKIDDYSLLQDILRYILPAGYYVKFVYQSPDNLNSTIEYQDVVRLVSADKIYSGGVRLSGNKTIPEVVNDVDTAIIVDNEDLPVTENKEISYGEYKKIGRKDLWETEERE